MAVADFRHDDIEWERRVRRRRYRPGAAPSHVGFWRFIWRGLIRDLSEDFREIAALWEFGGQLRT
jgi:hypothetical protein